MNVTKSMEIPAKFLESDSDDDDGISSTPPPSAPPSPTLPSLSLAPPPSLSLAPSSSSSSDIILPETEDIKAIEEATEVFYQDLNEKYKKEVDEVMANWEEIKRAVGAFGYEPFVEAGMDAERDEALQKVQKDYEAKMKDLEDQLVEAAAKLPEPKKAYISDSEKAFRDRYPSIFSKSHVEHDDADLEHRLHSLYYSRRDARHDSPPHFETREEAEHRKAEAKRLDSEAASRLAKEEVLKSLHTMKPMQRLETIVYKAKKSSDIDRQADELLQNYLNSQALKNLYMAEIPKRDQSKEGWRQFKEDVRAAFGKRKLELISEKEKSNISAFPYSSDESGSSSDEEEESPKTPSKLMSRSIEIAKKFGEVTPAAASRVGTAASQKGSESDSDNDDDEEYFRDDEEEEEEKDFDPRTLKSKAISEIMEDSRSAVKKAGGSLKQSARIDILTDLLDAVTKLKGVDRIRAFSLLKDGSLKYHGGNISVFEAKDNINRELRSLRKSSKSSSSTSTVTKKRH